MSIHNNWSYDAFLWNSSTKTIWLRPTKLSTTLGLFQQRKR